MFVTIGKLFNICVHDNNECISSTLRTKNSWETYITEVFLEIFKKLKNRYWSQHRILFFISIVTGNKSSSIRTSCEKSRTVYLV